MKCSRKISPLHSILFLLNFACGFHSVNALVAPNPSAFSATRPIPPHWRLVLLPGFGNDAQDYISPPILATNEALAAPSSGSFVDSLLRRGWQREQIHVLPVQRYEWLQVFVYGCFDVQFWQGTAPPTNPAFAWYLQRVQAVLESCAADDDDAEVVLVGHSAGGWLARAAAQVGASPRVRAVVTLGTPNVPHPTMDMTRGALRWTHDTYPGAYQPSPERTVFYLTVCGTAVTGQRDSERPTERFAYNSYDVVCGKGETLGDGTCFVCWHSFGSSAVSHFFAYTIFNVLFRQRCRRGSGLCSAFRRCRAIGPTQCLSLHQRTGPVVRLGCCHGSMAFRSLGAIDRESFDTGSPINR
jgi:pimeloyl-ACP methyl ester carboxylesterase